MLAMMVIAFTSYGLNACHAINTTLDSSVITDTSDPCNPILTVCYTITVGNGNFGICGRRTEVSVGAFTFGVDFQNFDSGIPGPLPQVCFDTPVCPGPQDVDIVTFNSNNPAQGGGGTVETSVTTAINPPPANVDATFVANLNPAGNAANGVPPGDICPNGTIDLVAPPNDCGQAFSITAGGGTITGTTYEPQGFVGTVTICSDAGNGTCAALTNQTCQSFDVAGVCCEDYVEMVASEDIINNQLFLCPNECVTLTAVNYNLTDLNGPNEGISWASYSAQPDPTITDPFLDPNFQGGLLPGGAVVSYDQTPNGSFEITFCHTSQVGFVGPLFVAPSTTDDTSAGVVDNDGCVFANQAMGIEIVMLDDIDYDGGETYACAGIFANDDDEWLNLTLGTFTGGFTGFGGTGDFDICSASGIFFSTDVNGNGNPADDAPIPITFPAPPGFTWAPASGSGWLVKANQPWSVTVCDEQGCEKTITGEYDFPEPEIDVAGFVCTTGDPISIFYGVNDGNNLGVAAYPYLVDALSDFIGNGGGALIDFGGGVAVWDPSISGEGQFEILYTITDPVTGCQRSTFEEIVVGNCAPDCNSFILDLSISEDDVCENQLIDLTVPLDANIVPFFDDPANGGNGDGQIDFGTAEEANLMSLFQFGVGAAPNFFSDNPYLGVGGGTVNVLGPANGSGIGNGVNPSIWGAYALTHSGTTCNPEEYIVYVFWNTAVAAAFGISNTCEPWVAEVVTVYPDPATLTVQQNYVGECLIDFTVFGPAGDVCEDYETVITIGGTGAQEFGGVVIGQNSFSADGQDGFFTDVDVTVYAPSDAEDPFGFNTGVYNCAPATTNFVLDAPIVYDYAHTYTCFGFFENSDDEYIGLTLGALTGGTTAGFEIIGATGVYLNFDGAGQDFGPLEASGSAPIAWNDGDLYFVYANQPWSITIQDFVSGCTLEFNSTYSFPRPDIVGSSFACHTGNVQTIFYGPDDAAFNTLGAFGSNVNLTEAFNTLGVPGVTDLGGGAATFDPTVFYAATGEAQAFIDYTITDAVTGCSITTVHSIVVEQCSPVCTSLTMDLSIQEDDVCDAQIIDVSMYLTPDVIALVDDPLNGGDFNGSGAEEIATLETIFEFGISAVPGFFSDDPYTSPNVINLGTGTAFGIGVAGEPLQIFTGVQVNHSGTTCYPEEYIIYGFVNEAVVTALGVPPTCRPVVTEVVTVYPDPANLTVVPVVMGQNCEITFEVQDVNGNLCVDYTTSPETTSIDGFGAGGNIDVTVFAPGDALAFGGNNALSVGCLPVITNVALNAPLAYAGGETYTCAGGININDDDEYAFAILGDITGGSGNYEIAGASGVYFANNGDGTATGVPAGTPLAGVADILLVIANEPWSLTIQDSDTGCELTINGVYGFPEPQIYMPSSACATENPLEIFIDPGWATGFYNVVDNGNIAGDFIFVADVATFTDLSAALTTIVPGQAYEFDPAAAASLMGGHGTVTLDFQLTDLNTGCVAFVSQLVNIQACNFAFDIIDPCECNDDSSTNGDDGTFNEEVAITGPGQTPLPAGQTWTVVGEDANGDGLVDGTDLPIGTIAVFNPVTGFYEVPEFNHGDAEGYYITVEGPNPAGDPGNVSLAIGNVCFYPDPQIVGVGPFCNTDTAVPLTGIPANGVSGTGVFAGPGVVNIAGVIYFDPSQAGPGEHIVSYSFTDNAEGDGSHNPGCEQTVEMTVVVYPEFDPTFDLPNQICTDQLAWPLVLDDFAAVQAYVAATADTDDTEATYITWYEQFGGPGGGDNGVIDNGDGTGLFIDFAGSGTYVICVDVGVGSCLRTFCQSIFVHPPVTVIPLTDTHYCADDSNVDLTTLFGVGTNGEDQWNFSDGTFYVDGNPIFGSDLVVGSLAAGTYTITYAVGTNQDNLAAPDDACNDQGSVTIEICADPDANWVPPAFLCEDGGDPDGTDIDDVIANLYALTPDVVVGGGVVGTDYSWYTWTSEGGQLYMDAGATTPYGGGQLTGQTIYFSPAGLSDQSEIEICLTVNGAGTLQDGGGIDLCAACTSTQCYEIPIVSEYEADLFDGWNQTWCLEEFRDFETIDLTQYLANTTPGNGYFTVTHHGADGALGTADDVVATNCGGVNPNPPTIVGCQDGFIWNLDTLAVGDITIRYTVPGSGECARYDEITITLEEAQVDCFEPPVLICEDEGDNADGTYDMMNWLVPNCVQCIDTFSNSAYYNDGVTTYIPFDTIDVNGDELPCYNYPFLNPGTQSVSIVPPAIPPGSQILSVNLFYTYERLACIAEGDLDQATVFWPDGTPIINWGNGAGPNGDDDHFGLVNVSYDELVDLGVDFSALETCTPQPFTYTLTSNAANFTINFGVEIIYATCIFEAILHESADLDQLGLDTIPLPWDANGDGDYTDMGDIPGGVYYAGGGQWYFDSNGINAYDGVVDVTFSTASCGNCPTATTQSVLVVENYNAVFKTDEVTVCSTEAMIDMTQYLSFDSDNGGNFSSTTHPMAVMGDFIDLNMVGEGNCATVVYDVADGVNTCGQATDTITICVGAAVDADWTPANYYCEGAEVELPQGGTWSAPYNTDVQAQLDADPATDIINTSNLSNASPVTLVYTVSNGVCDAEEEYLLIIESSYDVSLSETELTACANDLESTGAIIFEDVATGNECLDLSQFLTGTTLGAGYWGYVAGPNAADLNGSIFCPTAAGSHVLEYTVPGSGVSGDCGASLQLTINIDALPDASWNCNDEQPTVICSGDGWVDLDELLCGMPILQTFTDTVCIADPGVEEINPGFQSTFINLPTIPNNAIITSLSVDYNYVAGPGNPNADGDIDLLTITAPDGTVIANWNSGTSGPNGNDNHFDYGTDPQLYDEANGFTFNGIAIDANSLKGCGNTPQFLLEVYSNSAFWNSCLTVSVTYTTGEFFSYLTETGEDVTGLGLEGGIVYENGGNYFFDPAQLCEINDITIEFVRFGCVCDGYDAQEFEIVCSVSADLDEPAGTVCYTDDLDLTQFFAEGTTSGGTFSGSGDIQGHTLVPNAAGGTYTITYTVGDAASACGNDSDTIEITVAPAQDATWDAPSTFCIFSGAYDLTNYFTTTTTTGGTFTVESGSGTIAGNEFTATGLGFVVIRYTVTNGDCETSWEEVINVVGDEAPAVVADEVAVCQGDVYDLNNLSATPAGGDWSGSGVTGSLFNTAGLPTGSYTLTYTVGAGDCEQSATFDINVWETPSAAWTSPVEVCADMPSFDLDFYVSGATGGSWSSNIPGLIDADGTLNPGAAGTSAAQEIVYAQVTYTVGDVCMASETEVISIVYVDPYFDGPGVACVGDEIQYEANVPGHWWTGDDLSSTGLFTPTEPGLYDITYSVGGLICHKTYTKTVEVYGIPDNPTVSDIEPVCEEDENRFIYTVSGEFFDHFAVYINGDLAFESVPFYGNELTYDPLDYLGEDFVGTASVTIVAVNQGGCESSGVNSEYTIYPSPVIEWELGCTDPNSNLAALEVTSLAEDFQIAVYQGDEPTAMDWNPVNDPLAIITAGEVYSITVVDNNGCTSTVDGVFAELAVDFVAEISCPVDGDVTVNVIVDENTGYGGPYMYSFDGGLSYGSESTATMSVAANPFISIRVQDQLGCLSAFQVFEIGEEASIAPTASCADADGNVTVSINYVGEDFTASYTTSASATPVLLGNASEFVINVADAMTVDITVEAINGDLTCTLTGSVDVYPALSVTADVDNGGCPTGSAETSVTALGGNGPYTLFVSGIEVGTFEAVHAQILPAGTTTLMVVDESGCTATTEVTVAEAFEVGTPTLVYNSSLSTATSVCGDDNLTLTVAGGTTYAWYDADMNSLGESGASYTSFITGSTTYYVSIVEGACEGEPLEINITYYPEISTTDPVITCNGDGTYSVTFTISGGNTAAPYFVNGVENFGTVSATLPTGTPFSYEILSPESGCTANVSGSDNCVDIVANNDEDLNNEAGTDVTVCVFPNDTYPDGVLVELCGGPENGEVSPVDGQPGCFTYSPFSVEVLADEFCYILTDEFGNSDDAIVTITYTACEFTISQSSTDCQDAAGIATIGFGLANAGDNFTVTSVEGGVFVGLEVTDGFGILTIDVDLNENLSGGYTVNYEGPCGAGQLSSSVECGNVTAIELIEFAGRVEAEGNLIYWTTASEYNSDFFTLQSSTDGVNFQSIAKVDATGNSSIEQSYSYNDVEATGTTYYRLLETETNGSTEIVSSVITLTRDTHTDLTIVNVFPVPTSAFINFDLTVANTAPVAIEIYDVAGKLIKAVDYDVEAGANLVQVDASSFAVGTYFVTIAQGSQVVTTKFIKD